MTDLEAHGGLKSRKSRTAGQRGAAAPWPQKSAGREETALRGAAHRAWITFQALIRGSNGAGRGFFRRATALGLCLFMAAALLPGAAASNVPALDGAVSGSPVSDGAAPDVPASDGADPLGAALPSGLPFEGALDLAQGSIIVSAAGYQQGGAAEVPYTGAYTITQTGGAATQNTITVTDGTQTITLDGVSIDVSAGANAGEVPCAFSVLGGDVTLLPADGSSNTLVSGYTMEGNVAYNTVSGYAGLWVKRGGALTIGRPSQTSTGSLSATAGGTNAFGGAGIGGSYIKNGTAGAMGNITINGGTIRAFGSNAGGRVGAGIGKATGDRYADATITINGGYVAATGYGQAAGIGGSYSTSGGHVVINGGKVAAEAKSGGAGIGAGDIADFGSVTINGGEVTAKAAGNCAGIGGCGSDQYMTCNGCPVTISGGIVTAIGAGYGTGIGGGGYAYSTSVKVHGGGSSSDITISGGVVTATGGAFGAGIGSGSRKDPNADQTATNGGLGTIRITGGNVQAVNGGSFAGAPYSPGGVPTGIGQGSNPGSEAAANFAAWNVLTDQNAKILTQKTLTGQSASVAVSRNGASWAAVAPNAQQEIYLWLSEGCYQIDSGASELVAAAEDKAAADTLIGQLNAVDPTTITIAQKDTIAGYETTYLAFSETLRYYADQTVTSGHTIAAIKAALDQSMIGTPMQVTLELAGGSGAATAEVKYGEAVALPIPAKTNYTFGGWFIGSTKVTEPDGTGGAWKYLSAQTLTARWVSEITGAGTQSDPYLLKSAANFLALSRVSFGTNTAEELMLFGINAKKSQVLAAHFQLINSVTLRTADGFYGIKGFGGTFDGGYDSATESGPVITLAIDTSGKIFTDPNDPKNVNEGKVNVGTAATPQYVIVSAALFMNLPAGAVLKNIHTAGDVKLVTKESTMALLAAELNGKSTISGCLNEADFAVGATFNTAWSGVMAGYIGGADNVIENCVNRGNVSGGTLSVSQGNASAAGIAAFNVGSDTVIRNCQNYGDIYAKLRTQLSGRSATAAGICSYNAASGGSITIEGCTNRGKIWADNTANNQAAGICTYSTAKATYRNCQNYGEVIANSGIAGAISGHFTKNANHSETTYVNCYRVLNADGGKETWKLSDGSAAVSGGTLLVPITKEDENYFDAARYAVDGIGAKIADLYSADSTHLYGDLTHNGNLLSKDYPFQSWADAYTIANYTDYLNLAKAIAGDTAAQTAVLGNRLAGADAASKSVALTFAHVKVTAPFTMGTGYLGIGTPGLPFAGKVDGGGNTVTYALDYPALAKDGTTEFGFVARSGVGAELKNLNFDGSISIVTTAENDKTLLIGPLLANGAAVISGCRSATAITAVQNFNVQGGNATGAFVYGGGLVGSFSSGTITNCTNSGSVSLTSPKNPFAGGIVGYATGTITACHNSGAVTSTLTYHDILSSGSENAYAGGIAAVVTTATLEGCTNSAPIAATNDYTSLGYFAKAGGLVASATTLTLKDCGAYASVSAVCTQAGGAAALFGGLCGFAATFAADGTNDYLKTAADFYGVAGTASEAAALHPIDVSGLTATATFGDTLTLCSGALPANLVISSAVAASDKDGKTLTFTKAGKGTVSLIRDGHTVYTSGTILVSPKKITSAAGVSGLDSAYQYTGALQIPMPVVKDGNALLVSGTDYVVTYVDNQDVGKNAQVILTFQNNYEGQLQIIFEITPGQLAVTADDYVGVYDGKAHGIALTVEAGAAIAYKETPEAAYTAKAPVYTNAGSYTVYYQVEKANYTTVTGAQTVTLSKAALTVTALSYTIEPGGKLPSYGFRAAGLQGKDTMPLQPQLACPTADNRKVGRYPITVSGAAATVNYEITYVDGVLWVDYAEEEPAVKIEVAAGQQVKSADLSKLAAQGKAFMVRGDGGATVKFDADALRAIAGQAGGNITVEVSQDVTGLTDEQKKQTEGGVVYELTVYSDGKIISDFGSGSVEVVIPYVLRPGENPDMICVWLLAKDGTLTRVDARYDPVSQTITFVTSHFSCYVVGSWRNPFGDVDRGAWYYDGIAGMNVRSLMRGIAPNRFAPERDTTRSMVVSMVHRLAGAPSAGEQGGAWYAEACAWAMGRGLTDGSHMEAAVTRQEAVTLLWRFAGAPKTQGDLFGFSDGADVAVYARDAMIWAAENGIMRGCNGKLLPEDRAARGEIATMFLRYCEKFVK